MIHSFAVSKSEKAIGCAKSTCLRFAVDHPISAVECLDHDHDSIVKKGGIEYRYYNAFYNKPTISAKTRAFLEKGVKNKTLLNTLVLKFDISPGSAGEISNRNLRIWRDAAQKNVGNQPPIPNSTTTTATYFQDTAFVCSREANQFLVYLQASLYRMPTLYPQAVKFFCEKYQKSKNFWLSLAFAVTEASMWSDRKLLSYFPNGAVSITEVAILKSLVKHARANTDPPYKKCLRWWVSIATSAKADTDGFGVDTARATITRRLGARVHIHKDKLFSRGVRTLLNVPLQSLAKTARKSRNPHLEVK